MYDENAKAVLDHQIGLIENLGVFALKALLTLNSGATVVLLALLGSLQAGGAALAVDVPALQSAMVLFLIGIACAMLAVAVTYVAAQLAVAAGPEGYVMPLGVHVLLMVAPAAASFAAFGWGFVIATFAFSAGG